MRPETHPRLTPAALGFTQSLLKLRDIDKEGVDALSFGEVIFESFTTRLSDETQVWGLRPCAWLAHVSGGPSKHEYY